MRFKNISGVFFGGGGHQVAFDEDAQGNPVSSFTLLDDPLFDSGMYWAEWRDAEEDGDVRVTCQVSEIKAIKEDIPYSEK